MRTQIAKTAHLPVEYIPPTFLTRYPLPLFRRLTVGAAIEKNFFWFYFFVSPIRFLLVFYFFYFFRFRHCTRLILTFRLYVHNFDFQSSRLDSFWLCVIIFFDSFNFRSIFLVCSSLCFTRINFDLFQHCRFYTLTLLLVINKHLCLWEFGLCLFWLF